MFGWLLYYLTFNATQYSVWVVIQSFRCSDTGRLFHRESVRRFKAIERQALRKLDILDAAQDIRTLSTLPGNRLERLRGNRKGQYSIRLTTNGASVLNGAMGMPTKLRLWITTRRQQDDEET
jgi:proteic killer suppression protein